MTLGDLSNMTRGLGYASRALNLGKMGYNLYNAASAGSSIGPGLGLGAVTAVPALGMMIANLIRSADRKNAARIMQGHVEQQKEERSIVDAIKKGFLGSTTLGDLKKFLDSPLYGSRTGDLLLDLAHKNLTGFYQEGRAERGGGELAWAPNLKLESLAAGLTEMGYKPQASKDPTGLIMAGGGFHDSSTEGKGTLFPRDVGTGLKKWNSIMEALASKFPEARYEGSKSEEDTLAHYSSFFPKEDKEKFALYYDAYTPGDLGWTKYMPEITKRSGYEISDLASLRAQLEAERQAQVGYVESGGGA